MSGDIDDEMECHVDLRAAELERGGLTPTLARARALEEFGDMAGAKAECRVIGEERIRRQRRAEWWDTLRQDLVFAVRALRRNPGFTVVAVLALAVGIGVNATVFALVDAVAFRPLPVQAPEELVAIYGGRGEATLLNVPYPAYEILREHDNVFNGVATFTEKPASLLAGDEARVAWTHLTSDNFFEVLGNRAARGRSYGTGELREPVVVLSDALWQSHFQADPGVIGRTIELNGYPFTVIGVAPPEFQGTRAMAWAPQLWVPAGSYERIVPGSRNALQSWAGNGFSVVARLRDRDERAALETALAQAGERVSAAEPSWQGFTFTAFENRTSINPWLAPPAQLRRVARLFVLGSALVLLIACADVANLLLARLAGRRGELALRLSLGAGRRRLIRQLLTENVVLALLAGVAALPLAYTARYMTSVLQPPTDHAIVWRATLDVRVLLFMMITALLAGVIAGIIPAVRGGRWDLSTVLRADTGGVAGRRSHLRNGLVVAQIAISVVVLSAAGLFVRNLRQARAVYPGFDAANAVVFTLQPQLLRGYDDARIAELYRELLARLRAVPGVRAVTRATSLPLDSNSSSTVVYVDGRSTSNEGVWVDYVAIDPAYHAVMGTHLVAGREFVEHEDTALRGVVINQALAEQLWPGENAVGKTIRDGDPQGEAYQVIGVSQTGKYTRLSESNQPAIAFALTMTRGSSVTVMVRSSVAPATMYAEVRRVVRELDPRLPLIGMKTLREHIAVSYSVAEGGAVGSATFGALALLLAAAGVYGVMSYAVAQRRREIGIRMALGAARADVERMVVRGSGTLAVIGIVIGCALAVVMGFALRGITYDGRGHDPLTLAAVCALLAGVALLASWLPARRAARVDPTLTMRL